jgi:hypothetical protein
MTEAPSRSRQQAEIAFAQAQSQFLAKGRRAADPDPAATARAEKTQRLRDARLARERDDAATPPVRTSPPASGADPDNDDIHDGSQT